MAITPANDTLYIKQITLPSNNTYEIVDLAARQAVDAMSTTVGSISSNLNSVSSRVNSLSGTVNSISGNVNSVSSQVNSLSGTVNSISGTVNSVSSNLGQLTTRVDGMSKYTSFIGVSSTTLTDGSTAASIKVDSTTINATTGAIAIYKPANQAAQEYIWDGSKWQFFGDIGAQDLGTLAYKNSVVVKYDKITAINTGATTVTSEGQFTPAGSITLTGSATQYVKISSTTVAPANTANYWVYKPAGTVAISASASGGTTTNVISSVTGIQALTGLTTTPPANNASLLYASVSGHVLSLNQLISTSANTLGGTTSALVVKTVGSITGSGSFDGTTIYSASVAVTVPDTYKFTGTSGNVSVTASIITSVTATSASTDATVSYT